MVLKFSKLAVMAMAMGASKLSRSNPFRKIFLENNHEN
jgi:hypothetical protein